MLKNRFTLAIVGLLAVSATLSGCTSDGNGAGGSDTFNDQDVLFVQSMIPHHTQAIDMVDILREKDGIDERVVELAESIKAAQTPEIEQMNAWLDEWDVSADMPGMDHGAGEMGGMMSEEDMANLDAASADSASRLFLSQMTAHHEGAIEMAQTELDSGENSGALKLAQSIIDTQQAEIDVMEDIASTL